MSRNLGSMTWLKKQREGQLVEEMNEKPQLIPNWLVKSLAWAFVASGIMWVGSIQGQVNKVESDYAKQDKELNVKVTQVQEKVEGVEQTTKIHFEYIKNTLNRIETKLDMEVR